MLTLFIPCNLDAMCLESRLLACLPLYPSQLEMIVSSAVLIDAFLIQRQCICHGLTSSKDNVAIDTALKGCIIDRLKVNRERVVANDTLLKHVCHKRRNNSVIGIVETAQRIRTYA